ncbi:hypothetical protein HanOQP8_Chr09g0312491 [Helianthus annuus]|nr:hypothetical protein HanHA89_Chr09g0327161 [Helianthus annuus]KAJ0706407.1 hypothetical protein HanLR1_Chr09g0306641 [Helianthus annuus]KAJ0710446.1 hypothetical protein HanOQP8_Chr09g0312491 [Helianthus annuus]
MARMIDDILLLPFYSTFYINIKVTLWTMIIKVARPIRTTTYITYPLIVIPLFVIPLSEEVNRMNMTNVFVLFWKLFTKIMDRVPTLTTCVVIPMEPVDFFFTSRTQTFEVLFCKEFILVRFLVFFFVLFFMLQLFRPQIYKI